MVMSQTQKTTLSKRRNLLRKLVRPRGFEPLASCSGGKRSIQLSYGRIDHGETAAAVRRWGQTKPQ
jgi:hypothetical protein